jgi:hypothetical protein
LGSAAIVPLRSEIDLAAEWEAERSGGPRPMLAVTGTDGKTTTTLLATAMLDHSGVSAVACGNTETPLVSALDADYGGFANLNLALVVALSFALQLWSHHERAITLLRIVLVILLMVVLGFVESGRRPHLGDNRPARDAVIVQFGDHSLRGLPLLFAMRKDR